MRSRTWTGPRLPKDDERFLRIVDGLLDRVLSSGEAVPVHLIRIDNWFGKKWLGFAGKVLGALGIHGDVTRADLVVPPFVPARVVWERAFEPRGDGDYFQVEVEVAHVLHRHQTSGANLKRKLADVSARAHFVWFSGNTRTNGRGSVMVVSLDDDQRDAFYVEFTRKNDDWTTGETAGNPPPFSSYSNVQSAEKRG